MLPLPEPSRTDACEAHAHARPVRGTGVAPVYTTFIRVYVNAGPGRAHVLLLPLRLLLSLTTNLCLLSLSLSLPLRCPANMIVSLSLSFSLALSPSLFVYLGIRGRDQTRRFSETAGIKDRGAMSPVCRRPLSRVTRVGTVDLSLPKNRYKDIGTVHSILDWISVGADFGRHHDKRVVIRADYVG